jgi:predicted dehydrogenase
MKQLLQSIKSGRVEVAAVPCPSVGRGQLLIATSRTLVSAGTERMLLEFGRASLVGKIRQQPDRLRMVLDKVKTDGLLPTLEAVLNKLDQPLPMGYCNVGVVKGIGDGVAGFALEDRVVSNGKHAEVVTAPVNLCAKVPASLSADEAAFTVLGAIALQGIRLVQPTLGEAVVVTGLGLIGQITVQLLRAHGCRVLGIDFDAQKIALAMGFGAEAVDPSDALVAAESFSRGRGVDAVIITAATNSNEPVHQAALMCRKRGRIVLVGTSGLELTRADFYEKELTFQVSCSYGPGRYDPAYEQQGFDYPIGFVRWTEQRNFEAVLDMLADRRLDVKPLISHRFSIDEAERAYELVGGSVPSLGILLEYPGIDIEPAARTVQLRAHAQPRETRESVSIGFIGAGNYATAVLIPAFKASGARLRSVASSGGVTGLHAARKFGFEETTTDTDRMLADPDLDAIVITTRHDSHGGLVRRALAAGKHVFVEKPLAMTLDELRAVEQDYDAVLAAGKPVVLAVGFNRRFAPQIVKIRALLATVGAPKAFILTVNAGAIPPEHWTQDSAVGGGRILGEACHFVDLLRCLAAAEIASYSADKMRSPTGDTVTISIGFADGSLGTIHYFANGSKAFPKERLDVFAAGRVLQLDNFRKLTGFGWPGFKSMNLRRQDKGQRACAVAFLAAVQGTAPAPIPVEELFEVSRSVIDIVRALSVGDS